MKSMNQMMICFSLFLTGGDIERLARVTEGNIIMPPKRLSAKQNLKQHLKKKKIVLVQLKLQIVILDGQDILEVIYRRYAKRLQ